MTVRVVLGYGINPDGSLPFGVKDRIGDAVIDMHQSSAFPLYDIILFSGRWSPYNGPRPITEAEAMLALAQFLGADEDRYMSLLDTESDTTFQQARHALVLCDEFSCRSEEVVVYTSELQERRAKWAFRKVWGAEAYELIEWHVSPDRHNMGPLEFHKRQLDELIKFALMVNPTIYSLVDTVMRAYARVRFG